MMTTGRVFPTRGGRWGIRQLHNGEPTGGGTIGCGWESREAAEEANPPFGGYTFEAYPRWPADTVCIDADGECDGPRFFFGARTVCKWHSVARGIY